MAPLPLRHLVPLPAGVDEPLDASSKGIGGDGRTDGFALLSPQSLCGQKVRKAFDDVDEVGDQARAVRFRVVVQSQAFERSRMVVHDRSPRQGIQPDDRLVRAFVKDREVVIDSPSPSITATFACFMRL
ncbi:hypothetical protein [Streptomyces sp. NPDC047042]|uniref:hypothetical protein n=1 Tax=Streptomyces sp. NPDC047042 TaxID=3154807 RepID=UPI0033F628A2